MQDQDYKVIAVSPNEAKPFTNSYGTTYYRDVRLADAQGNEHPKPVSLGKKDANAFQVGMELYGHILAEQSFPTDKFKSVSKQQGSFGGGGFSKASGSNDRSTYKDNSDGQRQGMCFNNAANYVSKNLIESGKALMPDEWAAKVHEYANALYKLGDLRSSESEGLKAPTGLSKSPALVNTKDPSAKLWPSDNDAEAESLYQSIAQAETVPLEDIPGGW